MILCRSLHLFFDRKTFIMSKYISELDDCEKSRDEFRFKSVKIVVEFCQMFFKLYDIGKDVFQFSID
ncbi:unnamed protein product, partial [Vitis vinifera]|uniref:Uncharacterized protein n=1 Tax=Vitis vinifera TaxID=29760 RepID=D7T060_VITVI